MTPETAEKKAIKHYLALQGWFVYHNLQSLGSYPGIPDLTAIKDGKVLMIEVKAKKGKQSQNQEDFQYLWEEKGGIYVLGDFDVVMEKIK